jgi:hypothetical protein
MSTSICDEAARGDPTATTAANVMIAANPGRIRPCRVNRSLLLSFIDIVVILSSAARKIRFVSPNRLSSQD